MRGHLRLGGGLPHSQRSPLVGGLSLQCLVSKWVADSLNCNSRATQFHYFLFRDARLTWILAADLITLISIAQPSWAVFDFAGLTSEPIVFPRGLTRVADWRGMGGGGVISRTYQGEGGNSPPPETEKKLLEKIHVISECSIFSNKFLKKEKKSIFL